MRIKGVAFMGLPEILIGVLMLVVVLLPVVVWRRKKHKIPASNRLILSDDYHAQEPALKEENDHIIFSIFLYKEETNKWICQSCECENDGAALQCCVCHQLKGM